MEIINKYGPIPNINYMVLQETNYLVDFVKRVHEITFLLKTTYAAMNSSRDVYYPRPKHWIHFALLCKEYDNTILSIQKCSTDTEYIEKNTIDNYYFLTMTLYTANVKFQPTAIIDDSHFITQYMITDETLSEEPKDILYVAHGSSLDNWYSILRNGLQSFSNTELQSNGMNFGSGIYMTSDLGIAWSYSSRDSNSPIYVLGLFEVNKEYSEKYRQKDKRPIYVFPNNSELKLKYFFQFTEISYNVMSIFAKIGTYLTDKIQSGKNKNIKIIQSIGQKRLLRDFKNIQDACPNDIQSVELIDSNIFKWLVNIKINKEDDSLLYNDMKEKNINFIILELLFPEQYPIMPPFARIVLPRFKQITGHITEGGSICMDLLTNTGWSSSYCIENLVVLIKNMIVTGEGKLHDTKWNVMYDVEEAKKSFQRVIAYHGWI